MEQPHSSATPSSVESNTSKLEASAALPVALALYRTPELRFDLRASPLPNDVEMLMRLAAGNQPLLEETAVDVDLPADRLVEIARFYLQQVLLEPGLDAYLVLGATTGSSHEQIRRHHYWLQRWLHPDHNSGSPEAVFAGRLNWAWQQLRTDTARRRYDEERTLSSTTESDSAPLAPSQAPVLWTTIPLSANERPGYWLKRGAIGVLCSGFLALLYLALVRPDYAPMATLTHSPVGDTSSAEAEPRPTPAAVAETPPAMPEPPASPPPRKAPAAPPQINANTQKLIVDKPQRAQPVDNASSGGVPAQTPAARLTARTRTNRTRPTSISPPAEVEPVIATIARPSPSPTSRAPMTRTRLAPIAPPPIEPAAVSDQPRSGVASIPPPAEDASTPRPDNSSPEMMSDAHGPAPLESPAETPSDGSLAASVTSAPTAATRTISDAALVERASLARARVRELLSYFRQETPDNRVAFDAEPPFNAFMQRAALRQRNGVSAIAHFAIDTPMWRLDADEVALDAAYRIDHARRPVERGHFGVRMTWQDEQWLVTQIIVEPKG